MTGKELTPYDVFEEELHERKDEIASLLPSTITREAFINTAIIAVKNNPELLTCDRRSLHKAVTNAALDGLRPDGKEGAIVIRNEKIKKTVNGKKVEEWITAACWQHMVYGVRKRARELDGIVIDAQVVYEKDVFEYELGDEPRLTHKPPKLGTARGKMIGAYAVFRKGNDILHREIMDAAQVEKVRGISKQPDGMMWTKFPEEGWRKSVVHRGSKTVPCSDALRQVMERDHDNFTVSAPKPAIEIPQEAAPLVALPASTLVQEINGELASFDLGDQELTKLKPEEAVEKIGAFLNGMHVVSRKEWRKANQAGLKVLFEHAKPIWLKVRTIIDAPDPPEASAPAAAE